MVDRVRVIRGDEEGWTASRIEGVSFRCLKEGAERNAGTYLIRMDPGVSYPAHVHPGGEEVYVVSGSLNVGGHQLGAGDYLDTPPGGAHVASTAEGCTFLVVLPKAVEFRGRG